jgi:hypothetical protein
MGLLPSIRLFNLPARCLVVLLAYSLISSCTFLSNRDYVKQFSAFQGVHRVAVFLQHWPVYLQKAGRNGLGDEFIRGNTVFYGPWQPAALINPRAVDIRDIDDALMGKIIADALVSKGYQVFLVEMPFASESASVELLMAQYQAINPPVDAFLFCYYTPTLFVSQDQAAPEDHGRKSSGLQEIVRRLAHGGDEVIWVGHREPNSPLDSMSHAFIYLSMTWFKALDWQTLMALADSQAGGKIRPWIPRCPPGPTDKNYWADPGVIQRLMVSNLTCRLRHMIPDAF